MGYDLDLFLERSKAEKFLCVVCQGVAKEVLETNCGHIFCRVCIAKVIRISNNEEADAETRALCPHCRSVVSWPLVHASKFLDREVSNLQTKCKQCREWRGPLMKLREHQTNECGHQWIDCEWKQFGCQLRIKRKDVAEHNQQCTVHHLQLKIAHLANRNTRLESTVNKIRLQLKSTELKWRQKMVSLHKKMGVVHEGRNYDENNNSNNSNGPPYSRKRPRPSSKSIVNSSTIDLSKEESADESQSLGQRANKRRRIATLSNSNSSAVISSLSLLANNSSSNSESTRIIHTPTHKRRVSRSRSRQRQRVRNGNGNRNRSSSSSSSSSSLSSFSSRALSSVRSKPRKQRAIASAAQIESSLESDDAN